MTHIDRMAWIRQKILMRILGLEEGWKDLVITSAEGQEETETLTKELLLIFKLLLGEWACQGERRASWRWVKGRTLGKNKPQWRHKAACHTNEITNSKRDKTLRLMESPSSYALRLRLFKFKINVTHLISNL